MSLTETKTTVSLPEDLRKQFTTLEQRLWRVETVVASCWAAGGLGLSYLALFVSDRIWETPVWLRFTLTTVGVAILVAALLRWSQKWVIRRRDSRALAKLVQLRFRRLGDRLLGIVELTDEHHRPTYFSPALYQAAVQQVSSDARQYDFREAVSLNPAKTHASILAGLLVLTFVLALLVPQAAGNTFLRWMLPTSSLARYTLVTLEGIPSRLVVAHGEPFEVQSPVQYRSFWHPSRGKGSFAGQPSIEAKVQNQEVRFQIPGQIQAGKLTVQVGDAKREIAIEPTHRPSLKELSATIALPEYLQYPPQTENVQNGTLVVVEGSKATFKGRANRALASAQLAAEGSDSKALNISGPEFSTETVPLDGHSQVSFIWKDEFGLTSASPWKLNIQVNKDLPPRPELPDLEREVAILESEVLQIKASGQDDFGVQELGLKWQLSADWQNTNALSVSSQFKGTAASPREKKFEQIFRFSPALLKVPADSTVEVRAYAKDYYPNREPAESPVYRVHVLGTASHADLVRQKLESMLARLEEVTRLEENVAEKTSDLKNDSQEQLASEKGNEEISKAKEDQAQNTANLEQLAKEGAQALRDAMKNPTLPEKMLREWAQNVQKMQQLAQQQMKEASQSLSSAEQNKDSKAQDLAKASEKQEEALQELEQIQQKINQGLDNLQALTLAQRLRKVAAGEKQIESELQKHIQETIGLIAKDLPAKYQRSNQFLASNQTDTQKEAQILHSEISRFFERTQQENYGQVSREMTEARAPEGLDKIRGLIAENITMEASQELADWSDRFKGWADKLDPKNRPSNNSSGSGSGGSGSGGDNRLADALMQQLLGLLRLRESEMNIRDRTLLLESQKGEAQVHHEATAALSDSQREQLKKLVQLQMENPFPALQETLKEIYDPMQESERLLSKAQTGELTVNAENQAIDTISDMVNILNEQFQKDSSSSSSQSAMSQEMAFLMQMMAAQQQSQNQGMTMNRNPGRSTAGGTTDQASPQAEGDPRGNNSDQRKIDAGSGITGNLPTEFRDALEQYFEAIEKQAP